MQTLDCIMGRQSIRRFRDRPVEREVLDRILEAGMAGPSCINARDWYFVAVTDHEVLVRMADANGVPARCLKHAPLGILVCGDLERAFPPARDYWVIDCSIACQNMVLAARDLGVGSVWLGTWPQMERVKAQRDLLHLPSHLVPHSILAMGYPAGDLDRERPQDFEEDKVLFV